MSTNFANHVAPMKLSGVTLTSPTEIIPGREKEMAINNAGGAVFTISPFDHLLRFLILGTDGGTYYASEKKHTMQVFDALKECIRQDVKRTVDLIVEVSSTGRAANNDPALFALAATMAFADADGKFYARQQLNQVARIGTHLFHFAQFVDLLKGWGSGTRKAFASWYNDKTPEEIAFQYIKYGQRDGWSHRDILRKAHPVGNGYQNQVYAAITHPDEISSEVPKILLAAKEVKQPGKTIPQILSLVKEYKLPREAIPTEALNDIRVWEALLPTMKPEAMIRNLGKMTAIGLLKPLSEDSKYVASVLTNKENLKRARIHPLNVLKAIKTYGQGHGDKGSLSWAPVSMIRDALEEAFNSSFNFVEPSGKNILLALDVSGSMSAQMPGGNGLTCAEATAVMALVTAKTETNYQIMGFSNQFIPLDIVKSDSFHGAHLKISGKPFGMTNCSLPMQYALHKGLGVDCFQVYTDNETFEGDMKPSEALKLYRVRGSKPKAKLAVVAFTATKFSIADPKDPFMLDFVGFDANAPQAMAELAKM